MSRQGGALPDHADPYTPLLNRIDDNLALLTDLFRRRLSSDRLAGQTIDDLRQRVTSAESGLGNEYLVPVVLQLARLIDRADSYSAGVDDSGFRSSVVDELLYIFETCGVTCIREEGLVDTRIHEVHGIVESEGTVLWIDSVVRRGYKLGDRVIRPATVLARREPDQNDRLPSPAGSQLPVQ